MKFPASPLPIARLATTAFLFTAIDSRGDWTRFRGPNGSGFTAEAQPPTVWSEAQNVAWQTALPGAGTSSPIIVGGRIFLTCFSGYGEDGRGGDVTKLERELVCVNRADGKILWSSAVPAMPAEDALNGMLGEHGYASQTPTSDGERVYVFFGKSGAAAFDLTGKTLWQTGLGAGSNQKRWGSASSPILYKNFVIICASEEGRAIVALDKMTGKEAWRATGDALQMSFGTPVLIAQEGRTDLVIAVPDELWGLNPDTGKLRWFAQTGLGGNIAPSVVFGDGMVFAFGGFPQLGAVAVRTGGKGDVTKTHLVWTTHNSTYIPTPIFHEGHLYFVSDAGFATCLDARTGELIYKERVPGASAQGRGGKAFYASPVLATGAIFAVSRHNGTFVIAAQPEFKLLAQNHLAGEDSDFNATPALADRQIFIRSNRNLYCLALPASAAK